MSLTTEVLRERAREAVEWRDGGGPKGWSEGPRRLDPVEVVPFLESEDRNVRVAALRVLGFLDGANAIEGILRGLDDPIKRVREVAAKCSVRFVDSPDIVERLRRAVEDDEAGSAGPAFLILGGAFVSTHGLNAVRPVADAMEKLSRLPKYRQQVLVFLIRARQLTAEMNSLLRDFVRSGSKDEAVMSTRRLCGYRVARREELQPAELANAERAWGNLWYWIRIE